MGGELTGRDLYPAAHCKTRKQQRVRREKVPRLTQREVLWGKNHRLTARSVCGIKRVRPKSEKGKGGMGLRRVGKGVRQVSPRRRGGGTLRELGNHCLYCKVTWLLESASEAMPGPGIT